MPSAVTLRSITAASYAPFSCLTRTVRPCGTVPRRRCQKNTFRPSTARTLVERLPAVTYIAELGACGPWRYVSPQIESMLGFSPAEWLSDPAIWINRVHVEDRENVLAVEEHFQKNRDLFQAEYRLLARD